MLLTQYFDHIVVINLAERLDRMREMERELRHLGISLPNPHVERYNATRPESSDGFPSIGARGCFLSHLGVLRLAYQRGIERVLILEDDATFTPGFCRDQAGWINALEDLPWNWCYLGWRIETPPTPNARFARYDGGVTTTHAYAVTRCVLPGLIGYLESVLARPPGHPDGGPMHVDGAFSMYRARHPELSTVLALPPIAVQRSSRSNVAPPTWFDCIPGFRPIMTAARSLRNALSRA